MSVYYGINNVRPTYSERASESVYLAHLAIHMSLNTFSSF